MTTLDIVHAYLASRRALGVRLERIGRWLHQFVRETGNVPLADIGPETVDRFLRGRALSSSWTSSTTRWLACTVSLSPAYVATSPLPTERPKLPPRQTPYIYSTEELQRMVDATAALYSRRSTLRAATYRTMLLLLYGAGMRVSEALGLQLSDVDLRQRIVTVRKFQFYKTRLVPVGPRLSEELAGHLDRRLPLAMPDGRLRPSSARARVIACGTGRGRQCDVPASAACRIGIACPAGEPRPPRLHDLRHTAAVHRVEAWYRDGKDVQRLLPQLATYLGHVSIASTQRYLQMTPQLLQQANQRFAIYALQEVDRD